MTENQKTQAALAGSPRWTFVCTRCTWTGDQPEWTGAAFADCPVCGNSCTTDEASFEPQPGLLDGA